MSLKIILLLALLFLVMLAFPQYCTSLKKSFLVFYGFLYLWTKLVLVVTFLRITSSEHTCILVLSLDLLTLLQRFDPLDFPFQWFLTILFIYQTFPLLKPNISVLNFWKLSTYAHINSEQDMTVVIVPCWFNLYVTLYSRWYIVMSYGPPSSG